MHLQCIRTCGGHTRACCHSNETCTPIANPQYCITSRGTPYHSPKLHLGLCCSVGMREGTDSHTDRQTAVANIHFALAMPHAKCNKDDFSIVFIVHLTLWSNFCPTISGGADCSVQLLRVAAVANGS